MAITRGREHTAACDLVDAVFAGACRLGPVRLVISHAMLDTLELVLRRMPVTAPFADRARDQIEAAAGSLCLPLGILGGTAAAPLLDQEDAAVLNTAMAGRADLLVTSNMVDFVRGPRARTNPSVVVERDGKVEVARLEHPRIPGELIIATPFRAAGWVARGERPPAGAFAEFFPCAEL